MLSAEVLFLLRSHSPPSSHAPARHSISHPDPPGRKIVLDVRQILDGAPQYRRLAVPVTTYFLALQAGIQNANASIVRTLEYGGP
jgi:hypothetical protein